MKSAAVKIVVEERLDAPCGKVWRVVEGVTMNFPGGHIMHKDKKIGMVGFSGAGCMTAEFIHFEESGVAVTPEWSDSKYRFWFETVDGASLVTSDGDTADTIKLTGLEVQRLMENRRICCRAGSDGKVRPYLGVLRVVVSDAA